MPPPTRKLNRRKSMSDTENRSKAADGGLRLKPCCALRVLRLTLKKKWFDLIASGEKRGKHGAVLSWNSRPND